MSTTVRNWLGNVSAEVDEIYQPTTISEVQERVGSATKRLLVYGARMSKTPVLSARPGNALDVSGLNQVLEIGPDYVVAQAGITLYDLTRALYAKGRQLPGFTITINPSIGGCISAPTKGANQPFRKGSNSISAAVIWAKVVRPDGTLVQLNEGEHDDELALLKDSYGTVGVVVEAKLRTARLMEAKTHEEIVPLAELTGDLAWHARIIENRPLMFPKLGCGMVRIHEDHKEVEPVLPFDKVILPPDHAYVSLALKLPKWSRKPLLKAAVWAGASRAEKRKLHLHNFALYPPKETFFLDFIQWSVPIASFSAMFPEVMELCRSHPGFPTESLVELLRINPEHRFFDKDDRMAFDPICFDPNAGPGWEQFYRDYNRFMVAKKASPFLNQTRYLDPADFRHIYGARYEEWRTQILAIDPSRKLGSTYLDHMLDVA